MYAAAGTLLARWTWSSIGSEINSLQMKEICRERLTRSQQCRGSFLACKVRVYRSSFHHSDRTAMGRRVARDASVDDGNRTQPFTDETTTPEAAASFMVASESGRDFAWTV